ncbi:hypothetical protein AXF42_Ash016897 [Apostasia shenzhenica]|uniref:UDP-MurNAc-pentapeptide synthetase n=1 Tax=Apostasia shenzhenica TaxID=1088818 RepID=A0A2H9ZRF3_9ASPA|nr:hypothetical protein AXF42_Ash016897 [Apostasia shenzhenica]
MVCNYAPRVLASERYCSCSCTSHPNMRHMLSTLQKFRERAVIPVKLMSLVCSSRHYFDSSNIRSSKVNLYAREAVVSERPDLETISTPPDSVSESFGTRIFYDDCVWNALEIAEAVGGEIVRWGPSGTISTDTRKLLPGQWFFAISGENFDGHDFVNEALARERGCVGVIGNRVCQNWGNGFIKVEGHSNTALEKMAKFARDRFRGVVVGLTGSAGKTTTRIMVSLSLRSLGHIYQTRGNLNNGIGVALTLIGTPLDAKVAVLELGMSMEGEILKLARMSRPFVRVILNVGHSHLENLHDLEGVAKAKGELLREMDSGDLCVLNADDPFVMSIPIPLGARKVLFGRGVGCDVRLVLAERVDGGRAIRVILESNMPMPGSQFDVSTKRTSEMVEFKIHGPGLHLAMNACAAAAVAVALGVPLPQAAVSLSRFRPAPMRSQLIFTESGITVLNDSHNASLPSMISAIDSLKSMECRGRRACILGDMLELGADEERIHEMVLNLCSDPSIELIMLVGERFLRAAERLKIVDKVDAVLAEDPDSLAPTVNEFLAPGDVVLVKGSRKMEMEKVVSAIVE